MGKLGVGKPQKSRRHKKVQQFEELSEGSRIRTKSLKRPEQKINARPSNLDQEIPRKIRDIQKFQEKWKDQTNLKKMRKKKKNFTIDTTGANHVIKGMSRPLKSVPEFKQRHKETDQSFMRRVDRETQSVLTQSKLEDEYNVEFGETNEGKTIMKKKPISKKKKIHFQKKEQKKKDKKMLRKVDNIDDFSLLTDDVQFGEVVEQPPSLTAIPRKSSATDNRPGKKSLLLKQIMRDNVAMTGQSQSAERQLGQSVKRKHLSMAQQVRLDAERDRVVNLYRDMKVKKMKTFA